MDRGHRASRASTATLSAANCPVWGASLTPTLGVVIYDSASGVASGLHDEQRPAAPASTPTFSATAGVTTADASDVWTSLGSAALDMVGPARAARQRDLVGRGRERLLHRGQRGRDRRRRTSSVRATRQSSSSALPRSFDRPHGVVAANGSSALKAGATITANSNINPDRLDTASCGLTGTASRSSRPARATAISTFATGRTTPRSHYFKNCAFSLTNGSALPNVTIGVATGGGMAIVWDNVQVTLSSGNQRFQINGGQTSSGRTPRRLSPAETSSSCRTARASP